MPVRRRLPSIALILGGLILLLFFGSHPSWLGLKFSVFSPEADSSDLEKLQQENLILKSELIQLKQAVNYFSDQPVGIPAIIFSRYPFNFKNELTLNVGRKQGIKAGAIAVFNRFLVGDVKEVFDNLSVVRTIFDNQWQSAVRIGEAGSEAILKGGLEPRLVMISKDVELEIGATVYSAAPDFPYGLIIGRVKEIHLASDRIFQEAIMDFPYRLDELRAVSIIDGSGK